MIRAPILGRCECLGGREPLDPGPRVVEQFVEGAAHGRMISGGSPKCHPREGLDDAARRAVFFPRVVDELEAGREEGGEAGRVVADDREAGSSGRCVGGEGRDHGRAVRCERALEDGEVAAPIGVVDEEGERGPVVREVVETASCDCC